MIVHTNKYTHGQIPIMNLIFYHERNTSHRPNELNYAHDTDQAFVNRILK